MRPRRQSKNRQRTFSDVELESRGGGLDEVMQEISSFLDDHPELGDLVHGDLTRGLKRPGTGRPGLDADQALRALVLQRIKDWDYRELRERVANGQDLRRFTRLGMDRAPGHDAFNRAFNRISTATIRQSAYPVAFGIC